MLPTMTSESSSRGDDAADTTRDATAGTPAGGMNKNDDSPSGSNESIESPRSLFPVSFRNAIHDHTDLMDVTVMTTEQAENIESESEIDSTLPLHSHIDSSHNIGYNSDALLKAFNTDLHDDMIRSSGLASTNSSQLTMTTDSENAGSNPFTLGQAANPTMNILSTRDISTEGHGNETASSRGSSISDTPSSSVPALTPPPRRRNSHTSRRHRPLHQMESISETRIANEPIDTTAGENNSSSRSCGQNSLTHSNNNIVDIADPNNSHALYPDTMDIVVASATSSLSTPRRRTVASGENSGSTTASGGNSNSSDSAQEGSSGGSSGTRRHRHGIRGDAMISARRRHDTAVESNDAANDNTGIRRRTVHRGNSIAIQLDAGMASLRRWIRARRSSVDGAGTTGAGSTTTSGQSLSSITTMHLGEDDIFALSHTGRDPRRSGVHATSTSSDPDSINGFLYYRPFEVHVHHDADAEIGIYGSDDESGTRSILLHPLVSSEASSLDERGIRRSRQRAYSEPDRARIVDFFSSIFGSRAIDGGNSVDGIVPERNDARLHHQSRRRNLNTTRSVVSTSPIIMEEADVTDQGIDPIVDQTFPSRGIHSTRQLSLLSDDRQPPALPVEESGVGLRTTPLTHNADAEVPDDVRLESDHAHDPSTEAATVTDPDREARTRWMRINRQFRCIVTSVAVVFSLLLFCIMISWVLLTSTVVLSHNKPCDVPLRPYFLLVSIQLMLDVFRAEIMKWLCRWRTDSQRRIPPRVILYNVGYLVYAMLVLRMGVKSVFMGESTCSSTAPELFYASLIFISLSLVAWATIFLGYFIPFVFVAVLLTQNGYFPNGDIASSGGGMGGRRARIGTGRIGDILGEVFPNTYTNPVPYGFVERLRVVLLHELPVTYQKDCCICMMEYKDGEVIVATPCEHVFHKRCLREWFQLSRTCPVCRTDVPEALGMTETTGVTSEDEGNRSISISESDEARDDINAFGRNENQQISNFIRFIQRERRHPRDASNRREGASAEEISTTARTSSYSNRDGNQTYHTEQMHLSNV